MLTGPAIAEAAAAGEIVIEPFDAARLSPNAYDWRLGDTLWICRGDLDAAAPTDVGQEVTIPDGGYVLEPSVLYLGHTLEHTSSEHYAQLVNGDRTTGALGISASKIRGRYGSVRAESRPDLLSAGEITPDR